MAAAPFAALGISCKIRPPGADKGNFPMEAPLPPAPTVYYSSGCRRLAVCCTSALSYFSQYGAQLLFCKDRLTGRHIFQMLMNNRQAKHPYPLLKIYVLMPFPPCSPISRDIALPAGKSDGYTIQLFSRMHSIHLRVNKHQAGTL